MRAASHWQRYRRHSADRFRWSIFWRQLWRAGIFCLISLGCFTAVFLLAPDLPEVKTQLVWRTL